MAYNARRRSGKSIASGGSGRATMLIGARGTGKTTLCDWLIESRAWPAGWVGLVLRGDLRQDLAALRLPLETLREAGTGLLLVVDESQAAPGDQLRPRAARELRQLGANRRSSMFGIEDLR